MKTAVSWTAKSLSLALACAFLTYLVSCPNATPEDFELVAAKPCYYVASWGDDTWFGKDENIPFRTIGRALAAANSDPERDTIIILTSLNSVSEDSAAAPSVFVINGTSKHITLRGRGNVNLSGTGSARPVMVIRGGSRVTLENITIQESLTTGLVVEGGAQVTGLKLYSARNATGIEAAGAGTSLVMDGGQVSLNVNTSGGPGGVLVRGGAQLIMQGEASVQYNTGIRGGGVAVLDMGVLTMKDGATISGNMAQEDGGGLYANNSSVRMEGEASISRNVSGMNGLFTGEKGGGAALENHATLLLAGRSKIAGNEAEEDGKSKTAMHMSQNYGSGVYLKDYSELTLTQGSEISDNAAADASAVLMENNCRFTLRDNSVIAKNASMRNTVWADGSCAVKLTDSSSAYNNQNSWGEIVFLENGSSLDMDSSASLIAVSGYEAVTAKSSTFTLGGSAFTQGRGIELWGSSSMNLSGAARISATQGVKVRDTAEFTMDGGLITGCQYAVKVTHEGTFVMRAGTISGNHLTVGFGDNFGVDNSLAGAAVSLAYQTNYTFANCPPDHTPTFRMEGGFIRGNSAGNGAGVAVYKGTFTKTGGYIYGNTGPVEADRNTLRQIQYAPPACGAAVYIGPPAVNPVVFLNNDIPPAKQLTGLYTSWTD
jgi:hypothetical protein